MDQLVAQMSILFPEFSRWFGGGFIVFARLLGFIRFAPVFNRKEIAGLVKLAFAFILTIILTPLLKPAMPPAGISPMLLILLNFAVGAIIGYIAQLLILAIEAGGDMINTQMGLSSAMVMDPTSYVSSVADQEEQTATIKYYTSGDKLTVTVNVVPKELESIKKSDDENSVSSTMEVHYVKNVFTDGVVESTSNKGNKQKYTMKLEQKSKFAINLPSGWETKINQEAEA